MRSNVIVRCKIGLLLQVSFVAIIINNSINNSTIFTIIMGFGCALLFECAGWGAGMSRDVCAG